MSAVRLLRRVLESAHRRVRGETGDEGATMIEMVVAMIIMTICGSIFVGAVVTLNRTASQAQAITNSSQENNKAYQALDKTVRYAAAISAPGVSTGTGATGNWYVELRDNTTGAEVCTQLRVDKSSQQLQRRTWQAANIATLSAWVPLASNVTNGNAVAGATTQPFYLKIPTPTAEHQRLVFNLVSKAGTASSTVSSNSSFELAALNGIAEPTGAICQQAGRP